MAEPAGRVDVAKSQLLYLSGEFAANADLSDSSLTQFIHSPLPLPAIKEFANQLTSRRRRKTCPPKRTDDEPADGESSRSSFEAASMAALDNLVHVYVGRYMRDTRHLTRLNLNKKFKACDLNERLRCRREQQEGPFQNCGSCSWAHGDALHLDPPILSGSTQLFRFVGDAKRLIHHASAYVTPYVYVFGGMTARGKSRGLWALNVCDGYWRKVQLTHQIADSDPPAYHDTMRRRGRPPHGDHSLPESAGAATLNSTGILWTSPNNSLLPSAIPETRFSHTLNAYRDRELILFGGDKGPGELNDLWRYDVGSNTWTEAEVSGEQPLPRSSHASVIWEDKLIIFGGAGGLEMFNDLWAYDLVKHKWTELNPASDVRPDGRSGHTCGISNSTLFVFGGSSYQTVFGDLWSIDLAKAERVWEKVTTRGAAPTARSLHTGIMIEPFEWLIFGGKHGAFCYNCDLFTLNTRTLVWGKESVFRPARSHRKRWWNAPEIIRQLPQLHCHSMSYDHHRGILVVTGGCDGDGSAKDSTLLLKKASTAPIVFEEWRLAAKPEMAFPAGSLPRFISEHYDPYAFELLRYL